MPGLFTATVVVFRLLDLATRKAEKTTPQVEVEGSRLGADGKRKRERKDVLLFYSACADPPAAWRAALAPLLPAVEFRAYPTELGDPADVTFALVYDPPAGLLASLPNLVATLSIATGLDHLTKDGSYPRGIPMHRMVNDYQMLQMAQYAVYCILGEHRDFHKYRRQQVQGLYKRIPRSSFTPETGVVVLGLGNMGRAIAKAVSLLGFATYGWSRSGGAVVDGVECFAGNDALFDGLLARCDFVVNALPLNASTAGLLDAMFFGRLRKGAVLINLGRGAHINDQDMLAALDAGTLSAAYLDVFNPEPLGQDSPFWGRDDVHITPHIGGELVPRVCAESVACHIRAYL